ncbi:BXL2 [Symbiodinium pilosum]|uniref:BXL2 protein n=1 Tax=Symbiodinium pilosum TaxID=2952 RepID=A0A812MZ48_SYMPI|nr:BXL2 [Symbiodinium pilosum]
MSRLDRDDKIRQITPNSALGGTCTTFTSGKEDIGLPPWLWLVESNTGVDAACPAEGHCVTNFVGPMGMAASFNRSSWLLKGQVLGTEQRALSNYGGSRFRQDHKNPVCLTGFGPNINIARDPRFGRTSELAGEDPLLSGTYAMNMVKGMQEQDKAGHKKIAAYLKHYTAYSTEANRGHDTYNISTFDFFDTYLAQYKLAFTAQPAGVMCSYDAENGRPSCANDFILNKQLRSWKPDAHVTTDCGAVNNLKGPPVNAPDDIHAAAMALMNGTDLEMGDTLFSSLSKAIDMGLATDARLTEAVRRSFQVQFEVGRFDPPNSTEFHRYGVQDINSSLHQQISYEAALQSFVLLKNDGHALPIKQGASVAVLGPHSMSRSQLFSDYAARSHCYDGTDACVPSISEGLAMANPQGHTVSSLGVDINSTKKDGIPAALEAARKANVVVLALGDDKSIETEGRDRVDTALPGLQESFAQKVLSLNKPTILVLISGGPMAIDSLIHRTAAPYAIVQAFFPSHKGSQALGATFFGKENRWGKLSVTMYPHQYIKEQPMTNYDMSRAPGRTYKYYQGEALYPFGHGLSLTTFKLHCTRKTGTKYGEEGKLSFDCKVTNTGRLDGDEVIQVYHTAVDIGKVDHPLPKRALRDFQRVRVAAGQDARVSFNLQPSVLEVVNKDGEQKLYPGKHSLIFTRGDVADEQRFEITEPAVEELVV